MTEESLPSEAAESTTEAETGERPKMAGAEAESLEPKESASSAEKKSRRRVPRTFPASSFMEALPLAEAIQRYAAGGKVRRLTLFDNLKRSPESGASRQLVTNSVQYGLTTGGYSAEYLELTESGRLASSTESATAVRLAARLELAIAHIEPFKRLYEQFKNNRLPALAVLKDFTIEHGTAPENADECVETFLANARDLGLVRNFAGAERLLTFEILMEQAEQGAEYDPEESEEADVAPEAGQPPALRVVAESATRSTTRVLAEATDLSNVCFMISPIGSEGSEQRRHANLVLGSLVEPALANMVLRLVRADKISKPGMITGQVIDHIVRAPLVVADLSFGNPNVFYELALRHACRKPVVQLVRSVDLLPFDVGQFRTVTLDMTDIYTLVPQIDSYRAEIARQCRAALDDQGGVDSPLSVFYGDFWEQFTLKRGGQ